MTTAMIKPERLRRGDRVAVVSLSSGMLGEKRYLHKYGLGKSRLEELFGLEVVAMPNALRGIQYLYEHPEKRAEDWMLACEDSSIKAIITSIGGDDGIRLLPYVDFDVLRSNPKVFLGYSDTTAHHLMMCCAGVVSFYGPELMSDFAAYLSYYLRGLGAQGILEAARGIIVGKPCRNCFYDEYKPVYRNVLKEFGRGDMPVLYNVNFGHCLPIGVIPYGVMCEMDATQRMVKLCESCVL